MKNTDKPIGAADDEKESWSKFEHAVDAAVKSGPMHKPAAKPKERPVSKGRVQKGKTRD
jgi:hypothetical protein